MTIHLLESYHQQSPLFKPLLVASSNYFANLCLSSQIYDPLQDSVGGWEHLGCWPSLSQTMVSRQRTALQYPNAKPTHNDGAAPHVYPSFTLRAQRRWKSRALSCQSRKKKVCEYLIMFYRSILPKSGSFLHPFPGAAGWSLPTNSFPRKRFFFFFFKLGRV